MKSMIRGKQGHNRYERNPLQRQRTHPLSLGLIVLISNYVSRLFWLAGTSRDRRIPFWPSVRSGMHFDPIAVDYGGSIGGIPPGVGIEVNEGENEGVKEKCDASRGAWSWKQ